MSGLDRLGEAKKAAYDAYWSAKDHDAEHAAVQRMIALGVVTEGEPCAEPECVELRAATVRALSPEAVTITNAGNGYEPEDLLVVTREVARGG